MKLVDFVRPELIIPELTGRTKPQVIAELARHLAKTQPSIDAEALSRVLMEREDLASTAIGEDIAIPHGKLPSATRMLGCVARSSRGVEFNSIDGKPTHLFFVLVGPDHATGPHLRALARISRVFKDLDFRQRLLKAPTAAEIFRVLSDEDAKY
ncbi:MAG TPA: PTS sugar transporter subunit IIA [Pseudomonadota bacterium]|jgi:PTS system nitrogen regulatory IIA component|nr:PTS sugar transporter subunit IIA [Deltaproteobacteria bacterium]HPH25262.1 PTS sugar transporter subunit IIA [Pseudomonadota bacterium]